MSQKKMQIKLNENGKLARDLLIAGGCIAAVYLTAIFTAIGVGA